MCVWCERYADGYQRWYFNPANYARRLYEIRKEAAKAAVMEASPQAAGGMALLSHDFIEAIDKMKREAEEVSWATHFGQVVTLIVLTSHSVTSSGFFFARPRFISI